MPEHDIPQARTQLDEIRKYMQAESNIGHLSTYATEPADPEPVVSNSEPRDLEISR